MNDEEDGGFLSRWSRRKREARVQERQPDPPATVGEADAVAPPPTVDEPVDLSDLPPIESLTADSDFSAFLRKGVPREMKNAALRKLWLTDPAIRDYKTLADYDWDFNAPGYGALLPTDDVKKLVDLVLKPRRQEPVEEVPGEVEPPTQVAKAVPPDPVRLSDPKSAAPELPIADPVARAEPIHQADNDFVAETDAAPAPQDIAQQNRKRRHGGAIPS